MELKMIKIHDSFQILKYIFKDKSVTIEKMIDTINKRSTIINAMQIQNIIYQIEFLIEEEIIFLKEGKLWLNLKH